MQVKRLPFLGAKSQTKSYTPLGVSLECLHRNAGRSLVAADHSGHDGPPIPYVQGFLGSDEGIATNVTLCFSAAQALLAAKAGATYISPFIGRLDDHGADGMDLIVEIRAIYDNYDFDTEILAASIRGAPHVTAAAVAGADCATIPPDVFAALFKHPLTERGLDQFMSDWAKTGQSIL